MRDYISVVSFGASVGGTDCDLLPLQTERCLSGSAAELSEKKIASLAEMVLFVRFKSHHRTLTPFPRGFRTDTDTASWS